MACLGADCVSIFSPADARFHTVACFFMQVVARPLFGTSINPAHCAQDVSIYYDTRSLPPARPPAGIRCSSSRLFYLKICSGLVVSQCPAKTRNAPPKPLTTITSESRRYRQRVCRFLLPTSTTPRFLTRLTRLIQKLRNSRHRSFAIFSCLLPARREREREKLT